MDPFVGEIILMSYTTLPANFLVCNGQQLSTQNANYLKLFAVIGTLYGGTNYSFNLPDLRGRIPVGTGVSSASGNNYALAQKGGQESLTLTSANLPSHSHQIALACDLSPASYFQSPAGNYFADVSNSGAATPYSTQANQTLQNFNTDSLGAGQAFANLQPYSCVNYLIAYNGTFPVRP